MRDSGQPGSTDRKVNELMRRPASVPNERTHASSRVKTGEDNRHVSVATSCTQTAIGGPVISSILKRNRKAWVLTDNMRLIGRRIEGSNEWDRSFRLAGQVNSRSACMNNGRRSDRRKRKQAPESTVETR